MIVGFTGTQNGMTSAQYSELALVIRRLTKTMTEFHHGDCIGSDFEFHECVVKTASFSGDVPIVMGIHPPINESKRAFCNSGNIRMYLPKDYLDRNHDIVDAVDLMIATPEQMFEVLRSGTWATIRYARKRGIDVCIIYPDGSKSGAIGI